MNRKLVDTLFAFPLVLGMLLAALAGPVRADERQNASSANQSLQSGALSEAAVGGVGSCDLFVTACNADHSATYECAMGVPLFRSPNVWVNETPCAGAGYCISHTDESGTQADFCGQCKPGTKYCDGKHIQWCDGLGQWAQGASCTIPCPCGTLGNGMCKLCQ